MPQLGIGLSLGHETPSYKKPFIHIMYVFSITLIYVKGTHTVYFSSSLYIINQKPRIPRTHFHCITTSIARSSG